MRRVIQRHKVDVYLRYVYCDSSAAPAAGYMALHLEQMQKFIDEAPRDALGQLAAGFFRKEMTWQ